MSDYLTPERLAEIEARAEAATKGPWHDEHGEYGCVTIGDFGWVTGGPRAPEYDMDSLQGRDDAEFIAHARADVPALLAEIERLRDGIEQKAAAAHYEWRILGDADAGDRFANLKELIYPDQRQ